MGGTGKRAVSLGELNTIPRTHQGRKKPRKKKKKRIRDREKDSTADSRDSQKKKDCVGRGRPTAEGGDEALFGHEGVGWGQEGL